MASTITKGLVGKEDIQLKGSGTTLATFTRPDSDSRTITLSKLDGAHIQFRTIAKSLDDLVDGGYDVEIKPGGISGGALNTTGHTVPNIGDDTFALLAASQAFTNKTLTTPKVDTINEETSGNGVSVDGCILKDGGAEAATDQGGGANLLVKVLDIGVWDMDASITASVAHGLGDLALVRMGMAVVRADSGTANANLAGVDNAAGADGAVDSWDATNVTLTRVNGGTFDSAGYDTTSVNLNNAPAVDKGGGLVGIPITAHLIVKAIKTTLAGTTNYDGTYTIVSVTANEIVITATYIAETFAGGGAETATWGRGWLTIWYTE